jgi:hypothetical protein
MATIIEFYTPKSFLGRPAPIPAHRCRNVLPLRVSQSENTLTPVPPLPMPRIVFAAETEQARPYSEGDHFPTARNFDCSP